MRTSLNIFLIVLQFLFFTKQLSRSATEQIVFFATAKTQTSEPDNFKDAFFKKINARESESYAFFVSKNVVRMWCVKLSKLTTNLFLLKFKSSIYKKNVTFKIHSICAWSYVLKYAVRENKSSKSARENISQHVLNRESVKKN